MYYVISLSAYCKPTGTGIFNFQRFVTCQRPPFYVISHVCNHQCFWTVKGLLWYKSDISKVLLTEFSPIESIWWQRGVITPTLWLTSLSVGHAETHACMLETLKKRSIDRSIQEQSRPAELLHTSVCGRVIHWNFPKQIYETFDYTSCYCGLKPIKGIIYLTSACW